MNNRIVDLSQRWVSGMPVVDGDPTYRCIPAASLEDNGFRLSELTAGTHTGTHVDAPAHVIANGATISDYPVDWLCGRARVFHVEASANQNITPQVLQTQLLKYLKTPEPEPVVLFDTGWGTYFETDPGLYANHPALSESLVQLLVDSGIRVLGVDTFSPDPAQSKELLAHHLLLDAGVAIVENLAKLNQLPTHVSFEAYPLPLVGADAAPVRAFARIQDDI